MGIPVERALIVCAAFTGLRLGELLALRWDDVDIGLRRLHVRRSLANATRQPDGTMVRREKVPKSGKVRSSVLVDEVIVVLDELSRRPHFTAPATWCSATKWASTCRMGCCGGACTRRWTRRACRAFDCTICAITSARSPPGVGVAEGPGLPRPRGHLDDDALPPSRAGQR